MINTDNLIETHAQLDAFAKHHQNIGFQKAYEVVKEFWENGKSLPRNGSPEGLLINQGFDSAFERVIKMLQEKIAH